jgi:hypothetical protein
MDNRETWIIRNVYFIEPRKIYLQLISFIRDTYIFYARKILTAVLTILWITRRLIVYFSPKSLALSNVYSCTDKP